MMGDCDPGYMGVRRQSAFEIKIRENTIFMLCHELAHLDAEAVIFVIPVSALRVHTEQSSLGVFHLFCWVGFK